MRKALFILALVISVLQISDVSVLFASENAQKYKYEYLFETELTTEKFKEVFYQRLTTKHQWSQMGETNLKADTYNSKWSFTDENKQRWECDVTISRESGKKVAVTLEMLPVLES